MVTHSADAQRKRSYSWIKISMVPQRFSLGPDSHEEREKLPHQRPESYIKTGFTPVVGLEIEPRHDAGNTQILVSIKQAASINFH